MFRNIMKSRLTSFYILLKLESILISYIILWDHDIYYELIQYLVGSSNLPWVEKIFGEIMKFILSSFIDLSQYEIDLKFM